MKNFNYYKNLLVYPNFFKQVFELDKSITEEEATEVISLVNPKNTVVIKTNDIAELKENLNVNAYEYETNGMSEIPVDKKEENKIYIIKGEDIELGSELIKKDGRLEKKEPKFNENEVYLLVNESFVSKHKYTVLLYIPD